MTKKLLKPLITTLCLLLIASPLAVVVLRYDGLYFLLYLAFWVMAPGYLILHVFKNNGLECKTKALSFIYAFLLGSGTLFIEFFTLHLLDLISIIKYINPLLSIIGAFVFYKYCKKNSLKLLNLKYYFSCAATNLPFLLLWVLALYISGFALNFYMPTIENVHYQDFTWQIGNVTQLAGATPFEDIRVAGSEFKYHYFNTLFYAIEKIIFGAPAWVIFTQHQIFIFPLLISLTFYNLLNKAIKNNWYVLLFSAFSLTGFSISHGFGDFMYQWTSNINAVALATVIICAMFFVIGPLLEKQITFNKKIGSHIIFLTFLLLYIGGTKGPYGAVFIVAIFCYIAMQILHKEKPTKCILLFSIVSSILFSLVYSFLLSSGGSFYFSNGILNGILASVTRPDIFSEIALMRGSRILLFIPSLLMTLTLTVLPLILCAFDCILYAFRKKEINSQFLFAAFMTVIGVVAYYTFSITGIGQVYFLFCAIPFVAYLSSIKMSELFVKRPSLKKMSVFLIVCFTIINFNNNIFVGLSDYSFKALTSYYTGEHKQVSDTLQLEFDAFAFLKQHVNDNRIIISNHQYPIASKYSVYHHISAFAEVNCYLEGYLYAERNTGFTDGATRFDMVQNFFSNNLTTTEKHAFALAENIGYVFIFAENEYPTIHPETGEFFEEIFANDAVTIYEVLV